MSKIDEVKAGLWSSGDFFFDTQNRGANYVRLLDTPNIWGLPFGPEIMPAAIERQREFERAIVEIIQKTVYRCDIASLNCPDPDWSKVILGAMDTALTKRSGRTAPTQFRFLFGQTPMVPVGEPWNLIDFKAALIRLIRARKSAWEVMPEIWIGRFYRLEAGIFAALAGAILPSSIVSDDDTKMTWNHSKVIAVDGAEALMGGHNLNMDLFRSYPPVHDVSVVVHGAAAYGSQLFLNQMWMRGVDLFTKQSLNTTLSGWITRDAEPAQPVDPLARADVQTYMTGRQSSLLAMHQSGVQPGVDPVAPVVPPLPLATDIRAYDLRSLADLRSTVVPERVIYNAYEKLDEYRRAPRILTVGKFWTGPNLATDFKKGSELMKRNLILGAKNVIRMSQMDLISAWKKRWSDHVVCHWILEALLLNQYLRVEVVVSPFDAGAGAEGDQYSFGSGAIRTFELIRYYMTHDAATDAVLPDPYGLRAHALDRFAIAPLYYTDQVPFGSQSEGATYHWPDLSEEGYTASLQQPSLSQSPPRLGIIGNPVESVKKAAGVYGKVPSAPGNHAKIMIVDDEVYVVGSDNLYPGNLSEINYLIEGDAVREMLSSYWEPLWRYSGPHKLCSAATGYGVVSTIHPGTTLETTNYVGYTDGSGSAEIRVTLRDSEGNPMGNIRIVFERTAGSASLSTPSGYTNSNGQFSSRISGTVQGSSEFRARYFEGAAGKYVVYGSPARIVIYDAIGTGG